ncbi:MAG: hypothetical protein M3Y21_12490 [Candidatus Eremiobacteraeota bacterium]|nr:hypothetical protein [Candidatus Eremiobacteraeota bacterium]
MSEAQTLGLAASFLAGVIFLLAALRPVRRPAEPAPAPAAPPREPEIYWPILLGTNERTFDAATRFRMVQQLGALDGEWKVPILLCAREQETDPTIVSAVENALGAIGRPLIGPPT